MCTQNGLGDTQSFLERIQQLSNSSSFASAVENMPESGQVSVSGLFLGNANPLHGQQGKTYFDLAQALVP